ncbi:NAD(P)-dependent oxidoreductase [Halobacillus shinanisalinarum]|uniref:NAD(P)-dependent oxidoreductase n=1 Tax=Halobacillus shinanisalinarum TaxID=2932258 RepID=A0ABY4H1Z5_9BACI|nr:NAD(P)-dependent oxidoreductase [Halobacillus shinanisalinarum]UOQ94467.1 NAD(P)-dependent oxidoreductase [Halobacillus shinanisalinarum]
MAELKSPTIGWIGTGVMGKSMAGRLLESDYNVNIFTRTPAKAEELLNLGAQWNESVKSLAEESDMIITMVGYPSDVEEVYFGEDGLLQNAAEGTYIIDMTTSSPELAVKMDQEASKRKIRVLDAPVSGGDVGAKEGTLSIMVGGEEAAFHDVRFLFDLLGSQTVLQGPAGSGQFTKMCNQIAIASNMMGVSESLVYAEAAGLDPNTVLESISGGAAGSWSLSNLTPRVIKGDLEPGFYVKHFIKDMKIAIESAEKMELNLPGLKLAKQLYDQISADGYANSGTQALYKYYK